MSKVTCIRISKKWFVVFTNKTSIMTQTHLTLSLENCEMHPHNHQAPRPGAWISLRTCILEEIQKNKKHNRIAQLQFFQMRAGENVFLQKLNYVFNKKNEMKKWSIFLKQLLPGLGHIQKKYARNFVTGVDWHH